MCEPFSYKPQILSLSKPFGVDVLVELWITHRIWTLAVDSAWAHCGARRLQNNNIFYETRILRQFDRSNLIYQFRIDFLWPLFEYGTGKALSSARPAGRWIGNKWCDIFTGHRFDVKNRSTLEQSPGYYSMLEFCCFVAWISFQFKKKKKKDLMRWQKDRKIFAETCADDLGILVWFGTREIWSTRFQKFISNPADISKEFGQADRNYPNGFVFISSV